MVSPPPGNLFVDSLVITQRDKNLRFGNDVSIIDRDFYTIHREPSTPKKKEPEVSDADKSELYPIAWFFDKYWNQIHTAIDITKYKTKELSRHGPDAGIWMVYMLWDGSTKIKELEALETLKGLDEKFRDDLRTMLGQLKEIVRK